MILSLGPVDQAHQLIEALQAATEVPLLVAADFESGVGYRLDGATHFGCNMLLGATGDPELARRLGRATAVEGLALGFHMAFAPVVDVNVNPANPIINMRSFGEDPALVGSLSAAVVEGMQAAGMLATAKHFPGHGDVTSDSHAVLPTVGGERARLDAVELAPFRAAIGAGVAAIMTGHLSVPGLGEDPGVPATLSHKILTELLRDEMGFDGLIVTDALDMGGVQAGVTPEEAAVRSLAAGADLLLMPPDVPAARDAVVEAVRQGRVDEARLDDAVGRLLLVKERLGLLGSARRPAPWRDAVASSEHGELAREIAARGVTLVRDTSELLPVAGGGRGVLLSVQEKPGADGAQLAAALLARGTVSVVHRLHPGSSPREVEAAVGAAADSDLAIVALHYGVLSYDGTIGLAPVLAPIASFLDGSDQAIALSFGSPYLIDAFPGVSTFVCAYASGPWTEAAVAEVLHGAEAPGRLPVTVPGIAERGTGGAR